jgi:hypothetical protein
MIRRDTSSKYGAQHKEFSDMPTRLVTDAVLYSRKLDDMFDLAKSSFITVINLLFTVRARAQDITLTSCL